jgi:glycyl-tRNA synthetase beta chain
VHERLRNHLIDSEATARQVSAVLASPLGSLADLHSRLHAITGFMQHEEGKSLVAANKRIGNMLKQQDDEISQIIDEKLFDLAEERHLFEEVNTVTSALDPLFAASDYRQALSALSALRRPVDEYFEAVMVMDDDPAIRRNRIAQLARLKSLFDRIADFALAD